MTPRIFNTRSEIKRAVFMAKEKFPGCRWGQAFLNKFPEFDAADREFKTNLWEDDEMSSVVGKILIIQQMNGSVERISS